MDLELTDNLTMPSGAERSAFDTAIPGQSWTKEPGSVPWEKPPMLNTADEAMDYFMDKFSDEEAGKQLISLLKMEIPVSTIVDSMLLAGFSEGLFSPDVAILLAEDLSMLIMHLGNSAGVKYKLTDKEGEVDVQDALHEIAKMKTEKEAFEKDMMPEKEPEEEIVEDVAPAGLMARQEIV